MGIVAPSFEDIDYQVRLAIDVAHDMLPLVAKASDVQGLALALAGLPVPTLKIIKKIQDKYRDPEGGKPSGKALNRFQILKDGL